MGPCDILSHILQGCSTGACVQQWSRYGFHDTTCVTCTKIRSNGLEEKITSHRETNVRPQILCNDEEQILPSYPDSWDLSNSFKQHFVNTHHLNPHTCVDLKFCVLTYCSTVTNGDFELMTIVGVINLVTRITKSDACILRCMLSGTYVQVSLQYWCVIFSRLTCQHFDKFHNESN